MILPFNYEKSFDDHRKDKRMVHSQKTLKNRLKNVLPNEASIKLFNAQNNNNNHESLLLNLYHFEDISKTEYQRILSNPLYFLQNERNLRMFRFYLAKNGYSENRLNGKFEQKKLNSRKKSLIQNFGNLTEYQFSDKKKVNYQQPWKYIESTIKGIGSQSKAANLSVEKNQLNQRKYSTLIQLTKQNRPISDNNQKDSPKIAKSLSTSFVFNIRDRQKNAANIKDSIFLKSLQRSNSLRVKYYSKILDSEVRVKKIKQNYSLEKQKINSETLLKAQNCQIIKVKCQEVEPQIRKHLSELRKICIKSAFNKSESMSKQKTNNFVPATKLKEIRVKQRKNVLKKMLQKRLGIQDVSSKLKIINPEAYTRETQINTKFQ